MSSILERLGRIQGLLTETGEQVGQEGFPNRPDFNDVVTAVRELTTVVHDVATEPDPFYLPRHGNDRHNQGARVHGDEAHR